MEKTLGAFKAQQTRALAILEKLQAFLQQGESVGVQIDQHLKAKLQTAIEGVAGDKLKIALVGGFSEGKTSIAAAWMEKLDKSSMNISHQESSNEVKVYDVSSEFVLIDTPGLFGFKEQFNAETDSIEKYKDITKKYVSEAHLVLYVMNSTNPIKESHKDDLTWLFRTLNLLPRTVFVLSRFDEVVDVEDEAEYQSNLKIKQRNVTERLRDLISLTPSEADALAIIAVAANPFDRGTEYWLDNLDEFKVLSHIGTLQDATLRKIKDNGGAIAIVEEAKNSVIRDVLDKQLPVAVQNDEKIGEEVDKLITMSLRLEKQLTSTDAQIGDVRGNLRQFVGEYFADLILQAKGLSQETFTDFFEREVGSEGVMVTTRLQNEFERQLRAVTLEVSKMKVGFDAEVNHFNSAVKVFGKQGLDYVLKSNLINNGTILATRDGLVSAAKIVGLDLGKMLKFKPWGAVNLAKGLNGALAVVGLAMEAWDTWEQAKRERAFREALDQMVKNFETQRSELLALINSPKFTETFFADFVELTATVEGVKRDVALRKEQRQRFHAWRAMGEVIEAEFTVVG
ncbi:LeoA/HP0731 family dynamin-like GTPase [Pseudomonas yamanorum]|jgi:GTP-binding protein EngB required for normal cell division|uniref:LeoA/HP0731 family dynamin-like GTPase n=1 Tax=Pseudomonas yamanorum TaxID=515393 RepID=A0ABU1CW74_9PSED|nr:MULTISPECIES: LeoA/HP0731 family dynamin-like GTPase [Pseudomonas]MBK5409534.1 50S ribosome-binding GTPase [Pseudomonas sp. TH34]MDR0191496.1 LeoA/HP0731 family dynamin-like GTPase [Pseudomonas yamanorum]NVZ91738.1 50S ribosome-binding GTPase [Pseudomonas yamanorum]